MVSATQAGLFSPSISTVTRITACTAPSRGGSVETKPPGADDLAARAHALSGLHRRREPHLLGAVVHAHLHAADLHQLRQKHGHQRQREVAVRDGRAERPLLRPLHVDVDPLVVVGGVGELVDALLRDRHPVTRAEPGADAGEDLVGTAERLAHASRSLQARWLDTETTSPVM
jgi:hypothetical protein